MLGIRIRTHRTAAPTRPGPHHDGQVHTVVVGLPPDTEPRLLPEAATATLARRGITANGARPHFVARTRRLSKLIDLRDGMSSGGPIRLLNLDAMRRRAVAAAAAQWCLWQHITDGTRPAQPLWSFTDRHRSDPDKYPFDRVQADYLAQPRVLAMNTYNALPHRICELPTQELEAFQAGYGTYVNLAWLAAVPADGLAPASGDGYLTATNNRLADQITYLHVANEYLDGLHPATQLAAMAVAV
jgi:hypothetical protein